MEAVHERLHQPDAVLPGGLEHRLGLGPGRPERLLAQHVLAGPRRPRPPTRACSRVGRADVDRLDPVVGEQLLVRPVRPRDLEVLRGRLGPVQLPAADRHRAARSPTRPGRSGRTGRSARARGSPTASPLRSVGPVHGRGDARGVQDRTVGDGALDHGRARPGRARGGGRRCRGSRPCGRRAAAACRPAAARPARRTGAAAPAGAAAGPGCAPGRPSPGRGSSPCPGAPRCRSSRPRAGSCGGRSRSPSRGRRRLDPQRLVRPGPDRRGAGGGERLGDLGQRAARHQQVHLGRPGTPGETAAGQRQHAQSASGAGSPAAASTVAAPGPATVSTASSAVASRGSTREQEPHRLQVAQQRRRPRPARCPARSCRPARPPRSGARRARAGRAPAPSVPVPSASADRCWEVIECSQDSRSAPGTASTPRLLRSTQPAPRASARCSRIGSP